MTLWGDPSPDIADWAAEHLGLQTSTDPDLAQFGQALGLAAKGLAARPAGVAAASARFAAGLARLPSTAAARWLGHDRGPAFAIDPRDRRFADPTWTDNPAFYALRQYFAGVSQLTEELIGDAGLNPTTERKARLAAGLVLDLLAPTNFLPTNPAALRRAFETGGGSLVKGARNFVDDVLHNDGRPRQVDTSSFTMGDNLAATPGKVVFRNELMELLQYEPQTKQVHATPLLCSPPWINKYYIMDLAPGRSFVEWAVAQNRTVFAISYLNPGGEMAQVTMDDYLRRGPETALGVIADITGADTVDIAGLCLGGALTAIIAAHPTRSGGTRVGNLTLLNTMLDYTDPGALGVFTEADTIDRLEKQMTKTGYLDGSAMAATFNVLRANDLIFSYVVANWLMGQDPPAFDILAWNADSTRMPAAMHAFYLRNFYLENRLATGDLTIAGEQIDLGRVTQQCYVVGAENDHIVPWAAAYATTQLVSGPVRFVLSSGGHIAGIVNPPGPKGWYLAGDDTPPTAQAWRETADKYAGSWWDDWARWSHANAGELTDPPPVGSSAHPVLGKAPGEYVLT
ncbi:MAG: Poly-beta-hydroxybutyrate polymerase domain protein [Pseudonocardiales bacterium]|nr:Poly-beta-hydroxybutyrate polymerase domain protein [Pseudonocardiales bacterium]